PLELSQVTQIMIVEEADVIYPVKDHGDAFDSEAKRPAAPGFRVIAHVFEDLGMHHAAAGDLQPLLAHSFRQRAAKIDFEARLGITEIMGTESNAGFLSYQFFENKLDATLDII